MFHSLDLINQLNINKSDFINFLISVRKSYKSLPYHNWLHAVDVTQFVFFVINNAPVNEYLKQSEIFALLVAAISHDIDHDGRNNSFHRKRQTILAQLAKSSLPPLELHHASLIINIIQLQHPTIFSNWSSNQIQSFEHFIVSIILATDIEQHQYFLNQFKSIKSQFDKSNQSHRILLCQIIMKCADLSNTIRTFEESKKMTEQLTEEFFEQGDIENELGIDISPMCDRKNAIPIPIPIGQIKFYNFIAGPLISELCSFFSSLTDIVYQYHMNLSKWTQLKNKLNHSE